MQKFLVVLHVTVNTTETVSEIELQKHLEELLQDFDAGNVEIGTVNEE